MFTRDTMDYYEDEIHNINKDVYDEILQPTTFPLDVIYEIQFNTFDEDLIYQLNETIVEKNIESFFNIRDKLIDLGYFMPNIIPVYYLDNLLCTIELTEDTFYFITEIQFSKI